MTRRPRAETDHRAAAPHAGLCGACGHARKVVSDRGSTFLRCRRADGDPRFPRYPRLPVLQCAGFEPARVRSEPPAGDAIGAPGEAG